MRSHISKLLFFGFFLFSCFGTFIPLPATAAGLVPCGQSGATATAAERAPCTLCHIVVGGNEIIKYGLKIMTFIAIAVIVAMAIFYIVSTGDEGMMQTAKSGIKAALIGFAVMLGAWLIVNTTLNILAVDEGADKPLAGLRQDGAFSFSCDTVSSTNSGAGGIGAVIAGTPLVTMSDVSSDSITVSWLPPAGSDSQTILNPVQYRIYRDSVEVATVATPTYTDTSVTPNTTYTYAVSVVDTAGNTSTQSTGIAATTPVVTDSVPISAVFASPLSGAKVSGAVGISVNTHPSGSDLVILNVNGNFAGIRFISPYPWADDSMKIKDGVATFTWDSTGVPDGPTTLSAIVYDGFSGKKTVSIPVIVSNAAPILAVPAGLTATPTSASQISLSWSASADNVGVTGYRVYRDGTLLATTTATTFSDTGLTAATAYVYAVQAFDAAGNISEQTAEATVTTQTPTPASATKKYHPGHYVQMYKSDSKTQILNVISQAGVAGIQRYYGWWEFETSKDVYDFSKVKADLDILKAYNTANGTDKRLVVQVGDKTFTSTSKPLPAYMDAYDLAASVDAKAPGWVAQRWHPYVIERYSALFAAMGKQFDAEPLFEGVANSESAFSLDSATLSSAINGVAYTPQLYRDALITVLKNAAQSFPTSNVFWYQNFFPSPSTDKYLDEVATAVAPYGVIMGGPDVLPDSKALLTRAYPRYTAFQGKMKLFIAAMTDSYREEHLDTTKYTTRYWTPNEMFLFARDNLHVNYIFWTKVCKGCADQPGAGLTGTYSWLDAIPVFKADPTFNVSAPLPTTDTTAPTVPTGLTAAPTSTSQINLSWTASTDDVGVTGYKVFRNGTLLATTTATATTYSDTGLTTNTAYTYKVRAFDAAGNNSAQTAGVNATTQASTPVSATKKYHPGHYITMYKSDGKTQILSVIKEPGVVGIQRIYNWSDLETSKDVYDFSAIQANIDILKEYNTANRTDKRLIIRIGDKNFKTTEKPLPAYMDQYNLLNTGNVAGYTAKRWDPYVVERYSALFAAIGKKFDSEPLFEGAANVESAMGFTSAELKAFGDYTPAKYQNALTTVLTNAAKSLPNSHMFWYMNFFSKDHSDDFRLGEIAAAVAPYDVVMGGPDILPDNDGLVSRTYHLYSDFNGKMKLFGSMQNESYRELHAGTTTYWTMDEMFRFARDTLHVNYIFWNRVMSPNPAGSNDLTDAIPVINANPTFNVSAPLSTSDTSVPTKPANFTASNITSTSTTLTWSASTDDVGVVGYNIYRDTKKIATPTATTYTDDVLSPSTSYIYTVSAYDAAGNQSAKPAGVTAVTLAPAPTATLSASSTSVTSGGSSTLTWSSTDATSCSASGAWGGAKATSGTETLTNRTTTGIYTLTCTGAGGTATKSVTIIVTAPADTTAPTIPAGLTATPTSASQINLSWTASTDNVGVTGYKVYRNGTLLATTTATTYSDTGLTAATAYTYTAQAFDAAGNGSAKTAGVSATTKTGTAGNATLGWQLDFNNGFQTIQPSEKVLTNYGGNTNISDIEQVCTGGRKWSLADPTGGSNKALKIFQDGDSSCNTGASTNPKHRAMFHPTSDGAKYSYAINEDHWFGYKIWIPSNFPSKWLADNNFTAHNFSLQGEGNLYIGGGQTGPVYEVTRDYTINVTEQVNGDKQIISLPTGRWVNVVYHVLRKTNDTGVIEVWIDGVKKVTMNGRTASDPNATGQNPNGNNDARWKIGLYWGNIDRPDDFSIFLDDMKYAKGPNAYSLVDPAQGGGASPSPSTSTAPTVTLSASSTSVTSGGSSTLTWSSTDATSCAASGAWGGDKATSGTQVLSNRTSTGIYTLTCTGTGGTATKSVTIIVAVPADTAAPTVPTNLTATPASSSQINLSWNASTDNTAVTGYKVFRNGTLLATTTATTYSSTGLTANTAYTYKVQAFDAAGNASAQTAGVSVTTKTATAGSAKLGWQLDFNNGFQTIEPSERVLTSVDGGTSMIDQLCTGGRKWSLVDPTGGSNKALRIFQAGDGSCLTNVIDNPKHRAMFHPTELGEKYAYAINEHHWIGYKIWIPSNFPGKWLNDNNRTVAHWSFQAENDMHIAGSQTGPVFEVGRAYVTAATGLKNSITVEKKTIPMPTGRWVNVIYHVLRKRDTTGVIEVWIDGVKKVTMQGRTASDPDGLGQDPTGNNDARWKGGLYWGDVNTPDVMIYLDDMKYAKGADGYALVDPSQK